MLHPKIQSHALLDKLRKQLLVVQESHEKISIHLDLLNVDIKKNLISQNHNTTLVRIKHLEKVENNLKSHTSFLENLIDKLGVNFNVSNSKA